jgi:hypothetical protein
METGGELHWIHEQKTVKREKGEEERCTRYSWVWKEK